MVDYKTGKKDFRLDEVMYGLDLQMLIYLNVLKKYGSERYGKEIVPAGIMYLPARNGFETVRSMGSDTAEKTNRHSLVTARATAPSFTQILLIR